MAAKGTMAWLQRPTTLRAAIKTQELSQEYLEDIKHKGPLGGASRPFAFKSRLLSRDATGGGSSRPEALIDYDTKSWSLEIQFVRSASVLK
jgi:hypothetical protein